ncbi:hypothetical protein J437_LFUL003421 [Ladona fulva]|uniref:Uncharacterized protein n=1 Tax=Ladona fulva TaxID=123851 RepID=A0A8K0K2N9_LADFU|nr:hypothetical protein J437_LFUL003421 [Ladona fulva]
MCFLFLFSLPIDTSDRQKSLPYGTDPEYFKMPTRQHLQASSSSKVNTSAKYHEKDDISSDIDNELSVIFRTLQDLRNLKENSTVSPRTEQKSASEKLLKITELQAAIGDLKRRNAKQRIVKMPQKQN